MRIPNDTEVPNAYLTGLPRYKYWVFTQVVRTQPEIRMGTDTIRTYLRIFGVGIQPWSEIRVIFRALERNPTGIQI